MSLAYTADSSRLNGSVVKSLMEIPPSSVPTTFRTLFVVAAGNEGLNVDTTNTDVTCPVRFDTPNLIGVAAAKCSRDSAQFTNYGTISVDIAAQGVGIWSTIRAGRWGLLNGTSMAAPFVTATAVLAATTYPTTSPFNHVSVKNNVLLGRQLLPSSSFLSRTSTTGGIVDACRAVGLATNVSALPISIAQVSPNPFNQIFTISTDNYRFDTPLSIGIYSVSGQLIQQHRLAPTFSTTATVNAAHLPMGLYVVKIQTADKLFTAKIVKSE
jgi:subtilisin family serine protease